MANSSIIKKQYIYENQNGETAVRRKNSKINDRIEKMAEIATLYYIDEMTQEEIGEKYKISRPMVSRIIKEARAKGIVEIRVRGNQMNNVHCLEKLQERYNIKGGFFAHDSGDDRMTNRSISEGAVSYILNLGGKTVGAGLGNAVGNMAELMKEWGDEESSYEKVCPLIGNVSLSNKKYHANGITRKIAGYLEAEPVLLHSKAFAETAAELEEIHSTQSYRGVKALWEQLDVMVVNIGNYPSTPDFASVARYGSRLSEEKAVGRVLAYYFNAEGKIICSDEDYAVQVPVETVRRCPDVIGICSANISPQAVKGALETGLIDHVIMKESLVDEIMNL